VCTQLPHTHQVFEVDHGKSWRAVLTSVVAFSASLYLISISPWYLLPLAWALSGTAFTGVGFGKGATGREVSCREAEVQGS